MDFGKIKSAFSKDSSTGVKQLGQTSVKAAGSIIGWTVGEAVGAAAGAKIGAAVGTTFCPGLGTAIGAVAGLVGGSIGTWAMGKLTKKLVGEDVGSKVEVEKMKQRKNKKGEDLYDIEATIYWLRNSHKGIIIGKKGDMLKRIGRSARIDMEQNFGVKVNLKTWVKVKEDWQDNNSIVDKFKLK